MYVDGPPGNVRSSNHMPRPNKEVVTIHIVAKKNITLLKMA